MLGRHLFVVSVATCVSCGGDDPSTEITCADGTSGSLAAGSVVVESGGADLDGAAIGAQATTTVPSDDVTIACAEDIAPAGFTPLGPAVAFGGEGTWSDRAFELTLPYKAARLPEGATRRHIRIVAKRAGQDAFFPLVVNRAYDDEDAFASRITFRAGELTTYQAVVADGAGQPVTENFKWNATIGISMGGNAAMSLATRNTDRFDIVADIGGEPGPSMRYTLAMVQKYTFGGFCTAADAAAGRGAIGTLCRSEEHTSELQSR